MAVVDIPPPPSSWTSRVARSVAVGVLGPRGITEDGAKWVRTEIQREITEAALNATGRRMLVALSGRLEHDIAEAALTAGFELEAVIPSENFADSFDPELRTSFEALLGRASDRTTLTYAAPSEAALLGAATFIVHYADVVIAVLDGDEEHRKDRGAAIFELAHQHKRRLIVLDPVARTVAHPRP